MGTKADEAAVEKMAKASSARPRASATAKLLSHNLNGQRLGRKGRDTRDRILAATNDLLAGPPDIEISLSAVARQASLGMTSLYNYFNDLTELLVAVLEPVMATAEDEYISLLRSRWDDAVLGERTLAFVTAYHGFWIKHSRLLHLRNRMADAQNERMMLHRVGAAQPVMRLLVEQMDGDLSQSQSPLFSMATALMTGLERVVTVTTDMALQHILHTPNPLGRTHLLKAEARLLELGIRDYRNLAA
ncbi:TetR/AcrR family transcriptional regulator [Sphingobium sp. BYY-5]|uniref:TetR/AcrR family transcriptional regulator n=1 Tax=Sphingobium sp. BYY-5 TaxID=2926400 RepID=UPI001FA6ED90|nr:TetR/AcrR family transcriptional regulator [Sphingobium sp. BYY-5]MCI4592338.1 TetR/AcrR family transcriptional regulator [Sphingobium sp. BYY-5]